MLYRAMSAGGHKDAPPPTPLAPSDRQHGDWIGIAEAADLLGVSRRQTQKLAANGLDGVRCGSTCGCRTTSKGKPCKVRVRTWCDTCSRHAEIESERIQPV